MTATTTAPARLGFGAVFTDDVATWRRGTGWTPLALTANVPLGLHPAAMSLHYGQAIFEGLKAYRQPDGGVAMFAPYRNAARFARSAARLAMPELPADDFVAACETLVCADAAQIPGGAGQSLYLRPFMLATEANLGVRASDEYLFAVIASPVDHFFSSGAAAIDLWCENRHARATGGGSGEAKCAGNYAGSLPAKAAAVERGCAEVLWLDAAEGAWVEELSAMNFCAVRQLPGRAPELVTPPLAGTILHGSTRAALLTLAADHGIRVTERPIALAELLDPGVRRSPRRSRAAPRRPWCRSAGSPPRPVAGGWAATAPDRSPRRWATRCWRSSSAGRRTHTDGCTGYPG